MDPNIFGILGPGLSSTPLPTALTPGVLSGSGLRVLDALLASATALSAETRLASVHKFEVVRTFPGGSVDPKP